VQRPLTSGNKGWMACQTPWPVGPTFQPLTGWLHGHALQEAVTRNPKLEVGGSQTRWSPGHMARPTGQHLHASNLIKSVTPPWPPYKYLPADGIQDITLYL
jgi:hypothetical protein